MKVITQFNERYLMINRFMRIAEVKEITGKSRSAIYADMAIGTFPQSFHIGARSVAWAASDIAAWVQAKMDAAKPIIKRPFISEDKQSWQHLSKAALAREVKKANAAGEMHASEI